MADFATDGKIGVDLTATFASASAASTVQLPFARRSNNRPRSSPLRRAAWLLLACAAQHHQSIQAVRSAVADVKQNKT